MSDDPIDPIEPPPFADDGPGSEPVVIRSQLLPMEAHAIEGRLAADGIKVHLYDVDTIGVDPLLQGAVGGAKVAVAARDADQARALLDNLDAAHDRGEDDMPEAVEMRERGLALRMFSIVIGAMFGAVLGLFVGGIFAGASRLSIPIAVGAGLLFGVRVGMRPRYHCSDAGCLTALSPQMGQCPGCGGQIIADEAVQTGDQ